MRTGTQWQANPPAGEWLGAESHMPNLGNELRRQSKQLRDPAWGWAAGAIFLGGLAIGSLAALLITRSRRTL